MHMEVRTTIKLINIFISSHGYLFLVVRTPEIYSKFPAYNPGLLTTDTVLYIRSSELIHFL